MKLVVEAFLSLDGVTPGPWAAGEGGRDAFLQGGWLPRYFDAAMRETFERHVSALDAALLGRRTYGFFAANRHQFGPYQTLIRRLETVPKYVASRSAPLLPWANTFDLGDDVVREVASLKREPFDELQVHGSASLVQTLLRHGLVDELRLWWCPLILGHGTRLFDENTPPVALKLAERRDFGTGVVLHHYQVASGPGGSLALAPPPLGRPRATDTQTEERT